MKYIKQFENFTNEGIGNFFNILKSAGTEKYYTILPDTVAGGMFSKKKGFAEKGTEVWQDAYDVNVVLQECDYKKVINGKSVEVSVFIIEGNWKDEVHQMKPGYGTLKVEKEVKAGESSW